ncbi:MAG: hybrid sensor histidine kinase/response regulator [Paludisphaera borealis]|uniref:hybrid sensor histidine kinase/response regulator n=1 Tax=Paludisphaera borealis TaxID=1387353 RepID=UPI00283EB952|nr:hybrid sensor histidine kinase/response regulator [Paludisphaera borealis]MDR3622596.1 hybrid sensor histidine kinase/response regulator [Paludisphaera borealis]
MSEDLSGFSMMDLFRMEADERLAVLSQGLVSLEGEASSQAIEPLMRAAHSLKGAARVVGLDAAVRVAHAMEDCLVAAQKGKVALGSAAIDVLLRGVDFLTAIAQIPEAEIESWQASRAGEMDALTAALADAEAGKLNEAAPPVPVQAPPPAPAPVPIPVPIDDEPVPVAAVKIAKPPAPASGEAADRVVRVTAESLSRLMGLAGESLVQTRRFRPFLDSLLLLKGRQTGLLETLQQLEDRFTDSSNGLRAVEREMLAKARDQAARCQQGLSETLETIEEFARGGEDLSSRLHHEVLASRMRPLADGVRGFPRLVRDVAKELGKQAKFEVVGETTGVDRDILYGLEAPLNHLIRNALDHGLETPDDRRARGKNPTGLIQLEARHRAGMLQIVLKDDGRGIDVEQLRKKVVEKGLTTEAMASRLNEAELLDFLFLPGFSTKEKVSELSGRGVGLDVVQSMVQAVRGSVRVASRLGRGTKFVLQLPLTVSVIRALLVEISGEPFAFPLNRIDRIVMVEPDQVREIEGKPHMMLDDQPLGLVEATQIFELTPLVRESGRRPVVVASDRSHRFGVVVDRFLGERDLRVAPLDPRLGRVPNLNSSSVLENGWPVLIIDVEDLIRSIDNLLGGRRVRKLTADVAAGGASARPPKRVLVVDDSITVRELERQLLENKGYLVDVAVDGVDGWNTVRSGRYDLVVSDIDMPRMDGIELVSHIKKDPLLRSIPVVVVSYKDREEDRIRGLDAGANFYLTKSSFHDQTFLATVVDLIGEARE